MHYAFTFIHFTTPPLHPPHPCLPPSLAHAMLFHISMDCFEIQLVNSGMCKINGGHATSMQVVVLLLPGLFVAFNIQRNLTVTQQARPVCGCDAVISDLLQLPLPTLLWFPRVCCRTTPVDWLLTNQRAAQLDGGCGAAPALASGLTLTLQRPVCLLGLGHRLSRVHCRWSSSHSTPSSVPEHMRQN